MALWIHQRCSCIRSHVEKPQCTVELAAPAATRQERLGARGVALTAGTFVARHLLTSQPCKLHFNFLNPALQHSPINRSCISILYQTPTPFVSDQKHSLLQQNTMIPRSHLNVVPTFLVPSLLRSQTCIRQLHYRATAASIPPPTPFVPDPQTFLTLIGRQLSKHAAKITTWESLFSLSSAQLRELGIEPPRTRRYLLWWREKFRRGDFGVGGDLQNVVDGVGEIRVLEVKKKSVDGREKAVSALRPPGVRKVVVNIPPEATKREFREDEVKPIKGVKVQGAHTIVGPHVELVKGTNGTVARIKVKDGMWEERRGHKVDGGERRKANVRSKRAAKERGTLKV